MGVHYEGNDLESIALIGDKIGKYSGIKGSKPIESSQESEMQIVRNKKKRPVNFSDADFSISDSEFVESMSRMSVKTKKSSTKKSSMKKSSTKKVKFVLDSESEEISQKDGNNNKSKNQTSSGMVVNLNFHDCTGNNFNIGDIVQ